MRTTTNSVERLDLFNAVYEKKAGVSRSKMLPTELYGCEMSPTNATAIGQLRTAIANCITFVTSRRSTDLIFAIASRGADVDTDVGNNQKNDNVETDDGERRNG